jgi:phosphoribosylformimino-5-aminoimidazole carboxamide ribotide isomerase
VRIYPAIDLRGGKCVRLRQGDYARETVFGDDPAAVARQWADAGATFLHLVDLDGAREGRPVNGDSVRRIVEATGLTCQLGGGLREEAHIETALGWGVTRVILGTKALQDPEWCVLMCREYLDKVALGIDARNGKVATDGWLHDSDILAVDLVRRFRQYPPAAIIYTDISKDGMLQGPNVEATAEVVAAAFNPPVATPIIASGGVTTLDDLAKLATIGVEGAIVGRALYEGRIDLREAINRFEKAAG